MTLSAPPTATTQHSYQPQSQTATRSALRGWQAKNRAHRAGNCCAAGRRHPNRVATIPGDCTDRSPRPGRPVRAAVQKADNWSQRAERDKAPTCDCSSASRRAMMGAVASASSCRTIARIDRSRLRCESLRAVDSCGASGAGEAAGRVGEIGPTGGSSSEDSSSGTSPVFSSGAVNRFCSKAVWRGSALLASNGPL